MEFSHDPIEYERELIKFVVRNQHLYGPIPPYMTEGVARYVVHGILPGSFLRLVIANAPFRDVVEAADDSNRQCLPAWAAVVVNMVPGIAQGSTDAMRAWRDKGGLVGLNAENEGADNA